MKPCVPIAFVPRSKPTTVPAWADPTALMALAAVRITIVVPAEAPGELVAKADPKRMGIGFSFGQTTAIYVGPVPNPQANGWELRVGAGPREQWFDLATFGPLVNEAWYVTPTAGAEVTVYEVYRLPGG